MKKITVVMACVFAFTVFAQEPIIDEWVLNTTNKTSSYWQANNSGGYTYNTSTTLADVLSVCYGKDTVWITSEGMTNDMGQFTNPGSVEPQGYTMAFPRNPVEGSGTEAAPEANMVGILINGIPIYGLGDGKSYSARDNATSPQGEGNWVGEAYFTEGETLDTAFAAHPQQSGAYHSHATPFRLYDDPSTSHSPLVGFANDGFPVYGPFGYSSATDASSGLSRMTSSFQLRNLTTRTVLPDGSTSTPPGPNVTTGGDWDIGTFIQDYEYIEDLGTLDEHNGRWCVTPEYPNGTYAYFVTVDVLGNPVFPYYIGTTYYGTPKAENNSGSAIQPSGSNINCLSLVTSVDDNFNNENVEFYPNPSSHQVTVTLPEGAEGKFDLRVIDVTSALVYSKNLIDAKDQITINVEDLPAGIYQVRIIGYNQLFTSSFTKE